MARYKHIDTPPNIFAWIVKRSMRYFVSLRQALRSGTFCTASMSALTRTSERSAACEMSRSNAPLDHAL